MSEIVEPEVKKVIQGFVKKQQSFISTDVYCKLGQHFDDSENPIHEQVRAAYGTDLMPNYLCRWVKLRLEGGGFMQCWKYYLPMTKVQKFDLRIREDGRVELSKRILGQFSLLECDLGCTIGESIITYKLATTDDDYIVNAGSRIIISANMLRSSKLDKAKALKAMVYPNKVEVVED